MRGDILSVENDGQAGEPLMQLVMQRRAPRRPLASTVGHSRAL